MAGSLLTEIRQPKKSSIPRNDGSISALLTDVGVGRNGRKANVVQTRGAAANQKPDAEKGMTEQKPPEKPQTMETASTKNTANRRGKDASLGREVQAKIGQQLRAYYDGLIEPTPDRFVDLLGKLDKPAGSKESSE